MKTPILATTLFAAAVTANAQFTVRPWTQDNEPLPDRVAADFKAIKHPAAFVHYGVPAMSSLQRLPDVYPEDGAAGGTVRIVAAKDEYEPGSFLIYPLRDLGRTQLSLTPFKTADGKVFPAADLDLKVVKVWYQNGNAWYSYFGDTGFKLVPELLLHDEDLIRVDEAKKANYARLTPPGGKPSERWINPPRQMDRIHWDLSRGAGAFKPMSPGFADAKTLQPVALKKGAFKNFFLTAHVRPETPAGLYRGAVKIGGHGEIPVTIRVLDFALPKPKAYFDDTRDFLVNFYNNGERFPDILQGNGGDLELAKRQFKAIMEDHVAHNQDIYWLPYGFRAESLMSWNIIKEAGMRTDIGVGGISAADTPEAARRNAEAADRIYGHHNFYIDYGDEPPPRWVVAKRPLFKANQDAGFKFIIAGNDQVFRKAGYLYDWHNVGKDPENGSSATLWNQFVSSPYVAWYACQHTGNENPDFNRRQNGLAPYLAGYSALCNYAHHLGPYNDDSTTYKPMVFTYGCHGGVIDTLQWEGFREGVDDIRYATALVKLARAAAKSPKTELRYAGNKALQYLASIQSDSDDLNACRAEMIRHILALKKALEK